MPAPGKKGGRRSGAIAHPQTGAKASIAGLLRFPRRHYGARSGRAARGVGGDTPRVRAVTTEQRPDSPVARELIDELEAILAPSYPPESRHGYSVEKLLREEVAFFVVSVDDLPAGCGGVQVFGDEGYAELKRMYVRPAFRGRGLGRHLVEHLSRHAAERGVTVVRLETGVLQVEAIGLYSSVGFRRIAPFGPYREDPVTLCMERRLDLPPRATFVHRRG
jgi:putative acetyltransferase